MHGLGDNLHIRAVVRDLVVDNEVYIQTPWPSVFHDLEVTFVHTRPTLRTQSKNAQRQHSLYACNQPPSNAIQIQPSYSKREIEKRGNIVKAMAAICGTKSNDFSLPIPESWKDKATKALSGYQITKPILFYRPLVLRTEWDGCEARNPDTKAYAALIRAIKDDYFVVSVADLVDNVEWMISEDIEPDVKFHKGELDFETMAGLASIAKLIYCSPGFAVILGQAVGSKTAVVFGAFDVPQVFDHGNSANLFITPIAKAEIFERPKNFDKRIDLDYWIPKLKEFAK